METWKSLRLPHAKSKSIAPHLSQLPTMHLDIILEVSEPFLTPLQPNHILTSCVPPDPRASASTHACTSLARESKLPPSSSLSHHRFDVAELIFGRSSTSLLSSSNIRQALDEALVRTSYMRCAWKGEPKSRAHDLEITFLEQECGLPGINPDYTICRRVCTSCMDQKYVRELNLKVHKTLRAGMNFDYFAVDISNPICSKAGRAVTRRALTLPLPLHTKLPTARADFMLFSVFSRRKWL